MTESSQLFIPLILLQDNKEKDMEIPVRATIISSVFTLSFFIGFSFYLSNDNFWPMPIIVAIHNLIPLPLTLVFSVKHTKNKNVKSQPPLGLHFHRESLPKVISHPIQFSHPLQFHEDFEKIEEIKKAENLNELQVNDNFEMVIEDIEDEDLDSRNVIVHVPQGPAEIGGQIRHLPPQILGGLKAKYVPSKDLVVLLGTPQIFRPFAGSVTPNKIIFKT